MKNLKCNFFLIVLVIALSVSAYGKFVVRLDNPTTKIISKFNSEKYDIAAYKPAEFIDLVVTENEYETILAAGFEFYITQTEEQMSENLNAPTELDGYRNYADFLTELQEIEAAHPDICQLFDIGDSRGKQYSENGNSNYDDYAHEIWAIKVSDNVSTEEDEPSVYYVAEHHAREPISLEVSMAVLNHILENYGTDPQITENVDNTQIWFVPLVNPDGHKIVTDETELMWRKNLCDNNENGSIDVSGWSPEDGVDPNRNYSWEWGGASANWAEETYQGTEAFSEPETQAVKTLIDSHHFVAGFSYHSYSELILFPFGYASGIYAPDRLAMQELAVDMAQTIEGQNGGYYDPMPAWELYPATGTTDDYFYGTHGIFGYTVELATEFIPPADEVNEICENNIQAAMILLNRVHHSTLTGHITDADTGEILEAQVFVHSVDDTGVYRNPMLSDAEFGRYYRMLQTGDYDVTFSAFGYESQTIEDANINSNGVTELDIQLVPSTNTFTISGYVLDGETGNPLQDAVVDIIDFDYAAVTTDVNGFYTIEGLYEYDYSVAVYKNGFAGTLENIEAAPAFNEFDFELYELDDGSFENGQFGSCWQMDGNNEWQIDIDETNSGIYSARSGNIYNNQTSSMTTSLYVSEADEISFYSKVSSEVNYDYLRFYVNDVLFDQWSGEENWGEHTYQLEAGFHTFTWEYYKDQGVTNGEDCGWIDDIQFPENTVVFAANDLINASAEFYGNYPNPFNPSTTFSYNLQETSNVTLEIFNIKGQKVKTIVNEEQVAGLHQVSWNGLDDQSRRISSGIYFSRFKNNERYTSVKKIILLK